MQARSPLKILIVEDNADGRDMLQTLLEIWGYRVESAVDGPGGVEKALAVQPDVALIDIGLPGFSGYQVAERIRSTPVGQSLLLIALTGYGQPDDQKRAMDAGFDAHLIKPVDPDVLAQLLLGIE